ncbi:meiotic nuclear division protein 1, partial [Fistulina hepatica ATCC 64428]
QAPRGLSAEEKRVKLLEIFHETLKELEKIAPKMKGIVSQSVKEVLQMLVDDGLVQGDKIGSSNFFWSFPSQQGTLVQARLITAKESRHSLQEQLVAIREAIKAERALRLESDERTHMLDGLAGAKAELAALEDELKVYGACDPVTIAEHRRAITLAKEAAVRWTDNYAVLLSHVVRERGVDPQEVRAFLGVDAEYEDIC